MTMSLFDDDFYSTRVKRRSRHAMGSESRSYGGYRQGSMLRVALISSIASSLLVVLLFVLLNGGGDSEPEAKPALAGGQSLVETSERIISASEKVRPGVVSIINMTNEALEMQGKEELDEDELPYHASMGSGVIFQKKDGKAYIITNAHVIQDAGEVQAVLVNGNKKDAKIIGKDIVTEIGRAHV